ncbi:hypothetical protein ATCC90586_005961 [Pythium insidiosum]|nr:hypothetical protein ATCC90586_005961 [Pythium insidiosum]
MSAAIGSTNPRATSFCPSVPTVTIDCENDQQLELPVCVVRPRAGVASECEIDKRCLHFDLEKRDFSCNIGDIAAVASLPQVHDALDVWSALQARARDADFPQSALAVLLDFSKAYDSLDRGFLSRALLRHGFAPKLVQTIEGLHLGTTASDKL